MVTVALVPARGGSKGLPGKNLRHVGGISLVARAVAVGREVERISRVVVSSDDDAILAEARQGGADTLRRPEALATDDARTLDVVRHLLEHHPDAAVVVVLQPTSPLRDRSDVERTLDALDAPDEAPCATTLVVQPHPPGWSFTLDDTGRLQPMLGWDAVPARRQEATPTYALNGAVYAVRASHVRAGGDLVGPGCRAVEMPRERSVDIDDEVDLAVADALARRSS